MTTSTRSRSARARMVAAGAAACAAAALIVGAVSATAVSLTGLADDARRTLSFDYAGLGPTPAQALAIAAHNARLAAGALLFALVAPRQGRRTRTLLSLTLAAVGVVNASAIGVAIGAYGERAAAAVALHLPLELAGLSLAGGAYLASSRRPLGPLDLLCVGALCALLLVIAAGLETYDPFGGVK